ncbi:MAG: alpha-galactosidase [Lentisphaeria bacterium]|nr:alpha-galactosidase [Lentisphaeria bacterium]
MIDFCNRYIKVRETEGVLEVSDAAGKMLCTLKRPLIVADRKELTAFRFLTEEKKSDKYFILSWQLDDVLIQRHLFFYDDAPALRYYDLFSAAEDHAGVYYSSLADVQFAEKQTRAETVEFFSSSDHANYRQIRRGASDGKNVGGYFLTDDFFLYKEGPMPDSRPIPGEYDFLWNSKENHLEMVGAGFDNLRKGELRRAFGVVIGLRRDNGLQRYQAERYGTLEKMEVLANSWPRLHLDVTEEIIREELELAAASGVTTLFIDDGYFSEFMGEIDPEKFPGKFTALAARAGELGIELGLWANPLGLDVRHPEMALWDGTENADFLEKPPRWNWLARTNDYWQTELQGGFENDRRYAAVELMREDCFEFMRNKLAGYYRDYGIRKFKFDLYQLTAFNTRLGDAQIHYEYYRKLLEELQKAVPGIVISMDITRRNRPGFDFGLDFGRLYLENRDRNYNDHRFYHPYISLGNFQMAAQFAPAHRLEMTMMPQLEEYSVNYTAGSTVFATALYWGLLKDMSEERRRELKDFMEKIAPLREVWKECLIDIPGEISRKGNWSCMTATAKDNSRTWLAVYRNGAEASEYICPVSGWNYAEKILGGGTVSGRTFSETEKFAFSLYELKK